MAQIKVGINNEFARHNDFSFAKTVETAAAIGYEYLEPWVLNGREFMSEAGYFMSWSMEEDPRAMRDILDQYGIKPSGLSAHSPLTKPEVSIAYLRNAIRFASDLGAPVVNTDEGLMPGQRPEWMSDEDAFFLMKYVLRKVMPVAEHYGIYLGMEPHGIFTTKLETMERILSLVDSPYLRVNYDTGNSYLAGQDPVEFLKPLASRVVHVHAKDIALKQAEEERGKVTGTPAGCACGDGLIDWPAIVAVLEGAGYEGVLSVECSTPEEAERSLKYFRSILK